MVSQKTVLSSLLYFSIAVFVFIWLMTMNFPEKKCNCSYCINEFKRAHGLQGKSRRNTEDRSTTILSTTASTPAQNTTKSSVKEITEHKLGVIVPYRDRFEELLEFVPYMGKYLKEKGINYHLYAINQVDGHRFNRASLINAGFLIAVRESCDYIAMHDVDLLPLNKELNYGYPASGPFHVAAPHLHPRYHYPKFIGGILLMTTEQFRKVNGLSTRFWGWGREDDELYMRITDANMHIFRPVGIKTDHKTTFQHNHPKKRKRDFPKTRKQFKESFKRDRESGLNTMNYTVIKRYEMTIEGDSISMVAVALRCNYTITPWCDD